MKSLRVVVSVQQQSIRDEKLSMDDAMSVDPDMQISRIRLSDKTSRFHPRHVAPKRSQEDEPEVPVQVREWIAPALASPDLVLEPQPPAQPHSSVVVDRPVRFGDGHSSRYYRRGGWRNDINPSRAANLRRRSGGETNTRGWIAIAQSNCRSRLCGQYVDGNCEEARADARGRSRRNASPHAEVVAGRKLAPRGRGNGAGRN
jgi:hypothetical protein